MTNLEYGPPGTAHYRSYNVEHASISMGCFTISQESNVSRVFASVCCLMLLPPSDTKLSMIISIFPFGPEAENEQSNYQAEDASIGC